MQGFYHASQIFLFYLHASYEILFSERYRIHREYIMKAFLFFLFTSISAGAQDYQIDYIGLQTVTPGAIFQKTVIGGLSGIDYDVKMGEFVAISDDRSKINPARFYTLGLDFDRTAFRGVTFRSVTFLKNPRGEIFQKPSFFGETEVDPEAIRLSPLGRSYFWTSEGNTDAGIDPFLWEMERDGSFKRAFTLPEKYHVGETSGVRNNLGFEGLTVRGDKVTIVTEGPLYQDGEQPTMTTGALVRFLELDVVSGKAVREFIYETDPVQDRAIPLKSFSLNGVVEILALGGMEYLVMERSYSVGVGSSIRIFLVDSAGATDVLDVSSLKGAVFQKATKTLLLDLADLGVPIENVEGMTFGKKLEDGSQSLILVSDNNFLSDDTQFFVFSLKKILPVK